VFVRSRTLAALALVLGLLTPASTAAGRSGPQTAPDSEIVGGQPADPGEYPHQVALLVHGVSNRFNAQFCGGSLISPDTVLTAGHCLDGATATDIDVLAGTHTLAQNGGGVRVPARRIRLHPGFNPVTLGNDLGIIQLGTDLPFDAVRTIQPGEEDLWEPATVAMVTGWGNRSPNGNDFPIVLHEVDVPIQADDVCSHPSRYGSDFIAGKMFCAGDIVNGGEDSCQGDSGGPIVVPDGADPVLIGVVSWGIGCARARFPGIYTELANYASFVNPYLDPDTAPDRVEQLRGQKVAANSFRMSWRPPTFDGGTRIIQYRVRIEALGREHVVADNQTTFRLRNLPSGRHLVQVTARNPIGTSAARTVAVNV
jgi:trypsin